MNKETKEMLNELNMYLNYTQNVDVDEVIMLCDNLITSIDTELMLNIEYKYPNKKHKK